MLRVVGGKFRGRKLDQPDKNITRATKDSAKEGLFNSLGNITDKSFLDCFGGSGAIGIEAYSRGANAVIIEENREAIEIIKSNLNSLKINDIKLIEGDFYKVYINLNQTFDIVFIDPPYKYKIDKEFLDSLLKEKIIDSNSKIILERESEIDNELQNLYNIKRLKYGRTLMFILTLR